MGRHVVEPDWWQSHGRIVELSLLLAVGFVLVIASTASPDIIEKEKIYQSIYVPDIPHGKFKTVILHLEKGDNLQSFAITNEDGKSVAVRVFEPGVLKPGDDIKKTDSIDQGTIGPEDDPPNRYIEIPIDNADAGEYLVTFQNLYHDDSVDVAYFWIIDRTKDAGATTASNIMLMLGSFAVGISIPLLIERLK